VLRATLKSLFSRKARLGLTAFSIVLGVGFVVGTFVLTDTMNKAFDDLFKTAYSGTDVVVRATSAFTPSEGGGGGGGNNDRGPIPDSILQTVQGVPGVASATGQVSGYAQMIDPATGKAIGGLGPPTIGGNWTTNNPSVVLRSGSAPVGPSQVVVDAGTANKHHLSVGQQIRIVFQGQPPQTFTISGIVGFGTADNLAGATVALFDTPTAQRVLGLEGKFGEIDVVAAKGEEATQLRTQIQAVLPAGVEAVTSTTISQETANQIEKGLGVFRTVLLVFAFIAVFVGGFIIFNTFTIIVAQRSRELALLRAVGASRRQVLTSVIVEAFVVGLIASLIGVVAGVVIAVGLKGLLKAFGIDLPSTALQLHPRTIVVALLVGCIFTVAAAVMPAVRASRVSPVEAMSDTGDGGSRTTPLRRRLYLGLPVTAIGAGLLLLGLFGHISAAAPVVGVGAALTFIGIAILAPILTRPVAGTIGAPIKSVSLTGKFGRQNAIRNPRRTASTASALMVGLGLIAMISVLSASLKASLTVTLERDLRADLVVSTSSLTSFSPQVAEKVRGVPGVAAVSEVRQSGFRVGGQDGFLSGVDPSTIDKVADLGISAGGTDALAAGKILIYTKTADANGWKVGDSIPTAFAATGSHPLTMGGTFTQNQLVNGDYLVSLDTYSKLFPEQLDVIVLVTVDQGADVSQVRSALEDATKEFGNITVEDQAAYRAQQAIQVNRVLGLVTALLAMAVFIALFGIVNTLGLSVLERRHEIGLLRAVGLGRGQTRRMIRWEAVIIALFGGVLGVAIGILFGWALQSALADQGVSELKIPVGSLIFWLLFAAGAGVLAAAWPARRAAKLNVLEAISHE
jgi:putative ABC transport system permease protein